MTMYQPIVGDADYANAPAPLDLGPYDAPPLHPMAAQAPENAFTRLARYFRTDPARGLLEAAGLFLLGAVAVIMMRALGVWIVWAWMAAHGR